MVHTNTRPRLVVSDCHWWQDLSHVRHDGWRVEAAANRLAAEHLGPTAPEIRTEQVLGWTIPYTPLSQLIEALNDPV